MHDMGEGSARVLPVPGTPAPRREVPFLFSGKHTPSSQGGGKEHSRPPPLPWVLLIAMPTSQKGSKSTLLMHMH